MRSWGAFWAWGGGRSESSEEEREETEASLWVPRLETRTPPTLLIFCITSAAAATKSLQSCPTLCDPIDISPPGSAFPGILQARTLEWVAISFSNAWKWKVKVKSLSKCLTLHDPMDCSLPGSSVHGFFQARVLEWGAIAFPAPPLFPRATLPWVPAVKTMVQTQDDAGEWGHTYHMLNHQTSEAGPLARTRQVHDLCH